MSNLGGQSTLVRMAFFAVGLVAIFGIGAMSRNVYADDAAGNEGQPPSIANIGFLPHAPKALKDRFPMCDAFLKVQWIDKEKMLGYAHYEAILRDGRGRFEGERRNVWALVDMNLPSISGDLYEYKRHGQLQRLFEKVRKGKYSFGSIIYKGEQIDFYDAPVQNRDEHEPLLSDHRQTVCVTYPGERRAWMIELKSVGTAYTQPHAEQLARKISKDTGITMPETQFARYGVLNIGSDGAPVYARGLSVVYSSAGHFYGDGVPPEIDVLKHTTAFKFPPSNRICVLRSVGGSLFFTTDGKDVFVNNNCSLTELVLR